MSDPLVGGVTVTLGSTSTDSMQFLDRHRERGRQLETFLRERLSRAPERNEKPRSHLAILLRLFTAESPWLVIFQRSSLASGVLEISIAAPLELLWVRGLHTVVDSGTITPDKTVRRVAALLGKEPQPVNMFYETVFPNVDEIFLFKLFDRLPDGNAAGFQLKRKLVFDEPLPGSKVALYDCAFQGVIDRVTHRPRLTDRPEALKRSDQFRLCAPLHGLAPL